MGYKRLYLRIPLTDKVTFSSKEATIHAKAMDISQVGIRVQPDSDLAEETQYFVEVDNQQHGLIRFVGVLAHQKDGMAGLKITHIDDESFEAIGLLVSEFQLTEDFIDYIGEKSIIDEWFVDAAGHELDFDIEVTPREAREKTGSGQGFIHSTRKLKRGLTENIASGKIQAKDIISWISEYYSGAATRLILWDFTDADLSELTPEDISRIIQVLRTSSDFRKGGKAAFVISRAHDLMPDEGTDSMLEHEPAEFECRIFADINKAKIWLGVSDHA